MLYQTLPMAKFCQGIILVMAVVASACCQHLDMEPADMNIFKETGSSVSFRCSLEYDSDNISLDLLKFQFCNGSDIIECNYLESRAIKYNTRELKINNVKLSDSGSFLCIYNNSDTIMSYRKLKVGYPPDQLKLECISLDYIDLKCTWSFTEIQIQNRIPTIWNVKFKTILTSGYERPCPEFTSTKTSITCYWPPGDHEGETFTPLFIYTLMVFGRNQLGSNENKYIINPVDCVKLTPVQKLSGRALSSTSVLLTWWISEDVVHAHMSLGDFTCQVQITNDKNHNVQEKLGTKSENVNRIITGLNPYQVYSFSVRCKAGKAKRGISWSEDRTISVLTLPSRPSTPPETLEWAYRQTFSGSSLRDITIFLKSVPMKQRNSEEINYSISIFDGKHVVHMNSTINTTLALGQLSNTREYKVSIKSENNIGLSSTFSQIVIPRVEEVSSLEPIGLIAEKIKPRQYLVSFRDNKRQQQVLNCVYVWCRGTTSPGICKEDLNWKIMSENVTSYLVDLVDDESDWIFGVILVNTVNKSSGIFFADCTFSSKALSVPDILLTRGEHRRQIKVLLLFDYCSFRSRPVNYLVLYNRSTTVGNITNFESDTPWNYVTHNASMDINYLLISDLMPATSYAVCVGILMRDGGVAYSEIKTYVLEAEVFEEDEIDLHLTLFFVFVSITFVCICICALRCIIQRLKDFTRQFDIDVPKIAEKNEDTTGYTDSGFLRIDRSNMSELPPEITQVEKNESRDACINESRDSCLPLLNSETRLMVDNTIEDLVEDSYIKTFTFLSEDCISTVNTMSGNLTETSRGRASSVTLNSQNYVLTNSFSLSNKHEACTSREVKSCDRGPKCSIDSDDNSFDSDDNVEFDFKGTSYEGDRNLFKDFKYSIEQLEEIHIGHGVLEEFSQGVEVLSKKNTVCLPNDGNYICIENDGTNFKPVQFKAV